MRLREFEKMTTDELLQEVNKTKILLEKFKSKCNACYRKQIFRLNELKKEIHRRMF